jgi:putative beta-lysine N-acetyltransferase
LRQTKPLKIEPLANEQIDLLNRRVIVDLKNQYGSQPINGLAQRIAELKQTAQRSKCTKIIVKGVPQQATQFIERGFKLEGKIPGYYQEEDAWWVTDYLNPNRKVRDQKEKEDAILETVFSRCFAPPAKANSIPGDCFHWARPADAERLSEFYSRIFETYPSRISEPKYLAKQIKSGIPYLYARIDGQIVSAIGAELDPFNLSAELSDCATDPAFAGQGYMLQLYRSMENKLAAMGYRTVFTLARALSTGMNLVAARSGYRFSGQLINNCNICGDYGTMNLWVKP